MVPCRNGFFNRSRTSCMRFRPVYLRKKGNIHLMRESGNESGFFDDPNSETGKSRLGSPPRSCGFLWAVAPRLSHSRVPVMTSILFVRRLLRSDHECGTGHTDAGLRWFPVAVSFRMKPWGRESSREKQELDPVTLGTESTYHGRYPVRKERRETPEPFALPDDHTAVCVL